MSVNDLTTISAVKEWVGIEQENTASDQLIGRLISRVSSVILGELGRATLLSKTYNEIYDGYGNGVLVLRQFPVTSLASLSSFGVAIPVSPNLSINTGYFLEPWDGVPPGGNQRVSLNGYCFARGRQTINVGYTAGYLVSGEAGTIAAADPYIVTPLVPYGILVADAGVTFANGTALTPVAGVPTTGQYNAPQPFAGANPSDYYTFATADAGKVVLLSYSYVPAAIEGAVVELVGERVKYKDHMGQASKSLGGQETMAFNKNAIPDYVKEMLQQYKSVIPL
jgi:hypothetical protein